MTGTTGMQQAAPELLRSRCLPMPFRRTCAFCCRRADTARQCRRAIDLRTRAAARQGSDTKRPAFAIGVSLALGSSILLLLQHPAIAATTLDSGQPTYHPVASDLQNLASDEEFWGNLARYARYFVTVLLGTAYVAVKPLVGLLRNPVTALALVGLLAGLYVFLNVTLNGMLGTTQEPLQLLDY